MNNKTFTTVEALRAEIERQHCALQTRRTARVAAARANIAEIHARQRQGMESRLSEATSRIAVAAAGCSRMFEVAA